MPSPDPQQAKVAIAEDLAPPRVSHDRPRFVRLTPTMPFWLRAGAAKSARRGFCGLAKRPGFPGAAPDSAASVLGRPRTATPGARRRRRRIWAILRQHYTRLGCPRALSRRLDWINCVYDRSASIRDARQGATQHMSFAELGLEAGLLKAVREPRLHRTHPHPRTSHPARPGRPRPLRLRPDGHRQDGRLHPARPATHRPPAQTRRALRRRSGQYPHPGRHPHPRAGRPDRRGGASPARSSPASASPRSTAASATSPSSRSCAGASTCWWPPPAACSTSSSAVTSTSRRSRSSSSTRPTACSTWASGPMCAAS